MAMRNILKFLLFYQNIHRDLIVLFNRFDICDIKPFYREVRVDFFLLLRFI